MTVDALDEELGILKVDQEAERVRQGTTVGG